MWGRVDVQGRPALYGRAGEPGGLPVLFLHGWALGSHSYKRSLKRLVGLGCEVFAPALPGFGGTADLPDDQFSIDGYAGWVADFLDAVGVGEPMFVIGHSFGGGVAIQTAHDHPDRVRTLVLVNSVGGSAWRRNGSAVRSMAERPLWDWGIHFPRDILPLPQITRVLPVILEDVVPNLIRNPTAVWRVAQLARTADLTEELEELKRRKLPVVVLWGEQLRRAVPSDRRDGRGRRRQPLLAACRPRLVRRGDDQRGRGGSPRARGRGQAPEPQAQGATARAGRVGADRPPARRPFVG